MRNKRKTRGLICAVCIAALLVSGVFAAMPGGDVVQPKYVYLNKLSASIDITSSGRVTAGSKAGVPSAAYSIDLTMTIEKSSDGVNWTSVKSWDTTGSLAISMSEYWYVVPGYTYRVKAEAEVYNANNVLVERASATSAEFDY